MNTLGFRYNFPNYSLTTACGHAPYAAVAHKASRNKLIAAARTAFAEQGYAAAVRQLGAGPGRIYGLHILPNIASTLIVSMTLTFPEIILLESGLSFLGLGVQPPLTSLGNMVGYGREYITRAPWIMLAPATAIVLTAGLSLIIGTYFRFVARRIDLRLQR